MRDAIDVFARVRRAVPPRSRARGLTPRKLFRSMRFAAQHPARTAHRASRAENTRATPRSVSGMRDAIDVFARVRRAVPPRSRARGLTPRKLFRSMRFAAQHPARTAHRASRAENARATPRSVSGMRDAIDVFARVRRAVPPRSRARGLTPRKLFRSTRFAAQHPARASRVARRRAMPRARPSTPLLFITQIQILHPCIVCILKPWPAQIMAYHN